MKHPNHGKLRIGPGGIDCPCCTKLPKNELKIKERRMIRRKDKVELKNVKSLTLFYEE